jgi:hypothetical protein
MIECIIETCNKKAFFNFEKQSKACYCIDHKENDMIFIQKRKCSKKFCNYESGEPSKKLNNPKFPLCKIHKEQKLKEHHCKECHRTPSYNYQSEVIPIFCKIHKKPKMISVNSKNKKQKIFEESINALIKNIESSKYILAIEKATITQELLQL